MDRETEIPWAPMKSRPVWGLDVPWHMLFGIPIDGRCYLKFSIQENFGHEFCRLVRERLDEDVVTHVKDLRFAAVSRTERVDNSNSQLGSPRGECLYTNKCFSPARKRQSLKVSS